jgi:hypothetical protein
VSVRSSFSKLGVRDFPVVEIDKDDRVTGCLVVTIDTAAQFLDDLGRLVLGVIGTSQGKGCKQQGKYEGMTTHGPTSRTVFRSTGTAVTPKAPNAKDQLPGRLC